MQHRRPIFRNRKSGTIPHQREPFTRVGRHRGNLLRRLGKNEMNNMQNNNSNHIFLNNENGQNFAVNTNEMGDVNDLPINVQQIVENADREQGGDQDTGFDQAYFNVLDDNNVPTDVEALVTFKDRNENVNGNNQNSNNNGQRETIVPREEVAPVCEIKDIEVTFERRVNVERGPVEITEVGVDECGNDLYKVERRKVKYVTGDWEVVDTDMGLGNLSGKQYSIQNQPGPKMREMQMQQQSLQGFRAGKHKSAY